MPQFRNKKTLHGEASLIENDARSINPTLVFVEWDSVESGRSRRASSVQVLVNSKSVAVAGPLVRRSRDTFHIVFPTKLRLSVLLAFCSYSSSNQYSYITGVHGMPVSARDQLGVSYCQCARKEHKDSLCLRCANKNPALIKQQKVAQ